MYRHTMQPAKDGDKEREGSVITWTSVDRLNMSIGLLYALCNHALDSGIRQVRSVLSCSISGFASHPAPSTV